MPERKKTLREIAEFDPAAIVDTKKDVRHIHIDKEYEEQKYKHQKKRANLPYRKILQAKIQEALESIPEGEGSPELLLQYYTALAVAENPSSGPRELIRAMKNLGEATGLFRQIIDLRTRRDVDVDEDDIVSVLGRLPSDTKRKILKGLSKDETIKAIEAQQDPEVEEEDQGGVSEESSIFDWDHPSVPSDDREGGEGAVEGDDQDDLFRL